MLLGQMTIDRYRFYPCSCVVSVLKAQISIGIRLVCSFQAFRAQTCIWLKYLWKNSMELSG